jgi:hypothetical protein
MGKPDIPECGLLHATRGESGLFNASAGGRLTEKQPVRSRLSAPGLETRSGYAELATFESSGGLVRAESATSPSLVYRGKVPSRGKLGSIR